MTLVGNIRDIVGSQVKTEQVVFLYDNITADPRI